MRTFLFTALFSVVAVSHIYGQTEREFFSRLIDALPRASSAEFKTPDSVARFFVQGIIDNRIQDTFRCVPLRQMFASDTFENNVRYVGNTYRASMGLPEDDYGRYLKLLDQFHYMPVQKCRVVLLLASDQSKTNLVEGLQRPSNHETTVVNKWREKLSGDLSFRSFTNATISSIISEPRNTELRHVGVLAFKEIHKVVVHVSVRNSEVPITFLVGIVDDNYQIRALLD